jgi:hypothetical protein
MRTSYGDGSLTVLRVIEPKTSYLLCKHPLHPHGMEEVPARTSASFKHPAVSGKTSVGGRFADLPRVALTPVYTQAGHGLRVNSSKLLPSASFT